MTRSSGCAGFFAVALVIGLVVCAVISVAALVDPFSWLPSVGAIFGDCPADAEGDCDLAHRYPGFWLHVLVNFAFVMVAVLLLLALAACVSGYREARRARFDGAQAVARYAEARDALVGAAGAVTALGLVPVIVAAV